MSGHVLDDVEAYALGTLDTDLCVAFDAHVATCGLCRDELARVRAVLDVLPHAVREDVPPRALRERVLAATLLDVPQARMPRPLMRGVAAAFVAAVIALAVTTSLSLERNRENAARIAALQARVAASTRVTRAAHRSASIVAALANGATYTVAGRIGAQTWRCTIVQPRGTANAYVVTHTPAAAPGAVYRVWVRRGAKFYYAGDLAPSADNALEMPMGLRAGDVVGFSSETGPAAAQPARPMLMQVAIVS